MEIGNLLTINGEKYLVLDQLNKNGINYIFTCKMINEEPTSEFFIFDINECGAKKITDDKTIEELLPQFSQNLVEQMNNLEE